MTEYREGQTARNAQGERVVFSNGQWKAAPRDNAETAPAINKNDNVYINKNRPNAQAAREGLMRLDEFDRLNERIRPSGGIIDRAGNWIRENLGDADLARMSELKADLARRSRQVGEGATSDFDAKQFMAMTGGADKPYRANKEYSAYGRRVFQNQADYQDFSEEYLRTRGSLLGVGKAYEDAKKLKKLRPPAKGSAGAYSFDD